MNFGGAYILLPLHTKCLVLYVTGSAKTCQDAGIFENHFLAFHNSVTQGDYNALCFTSVACSVAKLRAPSFPAPRKKDWNNCV